jgi:hypothetical protein
MPAGFERGSVGAGACVGGSACGDRLGPLLGRRSTSGTAAGGCQLAGSSDC